MTGVGTDSGSFEDRTQGLLDWTRNHSRALTAAATVILVAAAGYWLYMRSKEIQQSNAEKQLLAAKQSIQAGNPQLAQSDLDKVFSRYSSTQAGVEAAMLLAQIDFDSGKYQDGISVLDRASGSSAASSAKTTITSLEGDGYSQMGKFAEAAKKYEDAANGTSFELEKGYQLGKAARAYQAGGNAAKAKEIWTTLANDPKFTSMAPEARVRLGELSAQPATK